MGKKSCFYRLNYGSDAELAILIQTSTLPAEATAISREVRPGQFVLAARYDQDLKVGEIRAIARVLEVGARIEVEWRTAHFDVHPGGSGWQHWERRPTFNFDPGVASRYQLQEKCETLFASPRPSNHRVQTPATVIITSSAEHRLPKSSAAQSSNKIIPRQGEANNRIEASMKKPASMTALEDLGRQRLSKSFYLRDFLYSEISNLHGISNIPDDPPLAIAAGRRLCEELLEPIQGTFGRIAIRSAYRSSAVNEYGNINQLNCASNEKNYAAHIWDQRDKEGCMGAMACIVIPWFADRYAKGADWRSMAWWIHDHLPYSTLFFFPQLAAFNIGWHDCPKRRIDSYVNPKGCLTRPGMPGHDDDHSQWYSDFPKLAM